MYIFAVLCIALMCLSVMLIILSLPGNWVILLIAGVWSFLTGAPEFTWAFFALLIVLAAAGEAVDFLAGYFGAKKYGGSNKGSLGGMIGAIAGAILFAPLLLGVGALFGALGGGFVGCYLVERVTGKPGAEALRAAKGATLGRFGGLVFKLGIAVTLIWLAAPKVWESAAASPL
ncbi:DUF456 domain-containing protein [Desulfovibrio sp. OttesenSCG-928-G15]|nr:DUF456 domain-containing protein [Desulfovibrio sp. OttesenSCG-928-G15]